MIWPRKTPRDRATVVMGIRPYFDAGWFNYPKYIAQDLLVVVVSQSVDSCRQFKVMYGLDGDGWEPWVLVYSSNLTSDHPTPRGWVIDRSIYWD